MARHAVPQRETPLPLDKAINIIIQIAKGLAKNAEDRYPSIEVLLIDFKPFSTEYSGDYL
jgi:hypothetical protein